MLRSDARYTMFYPLYPIGIGAEWWLMYRSVGSVGRVNGVLPYVWYFLLALYVPGKWVVYGRGEKELMLYRRVYDVHAYGQAEEEDPSEDGKGRLGRLDSGIMFLARDFGAGGFQRGGVWNDYTSTWMCSTHLDFATRPWLISTLLSPDREYP
jgi:hypothetical protein